MGQRLLIAAAVLTATLTVSSAAHVEERPEVDWHGAGWLGSGWGRHWSRDPIVGVYGPVYRYDPYASYRNDNGCYRMLPVLTAIGPQLRRVFVCDF
ncbi:hypothetical protein HNR60_003322 [Rhodopseudomonas rhenobacensis]|uniref:Uncharacterized protein n=1 Tax=Rhodopseudomonas rhenobacensis TaxID=87461 RepID=A0A7W7Z669_9BRAD|nr:hypothetical protein [Rhodopseudomonas rhenobacensis]MBB5048555.1 hypothetical protein [Rhodopseudomonas rhenobacensis]